MANYMDISISLSKAIFTTSDKGASTLYSWFKNDTYNQNRVLQEYIYLKYSQAVLFLHLYAQEHPDQKQFIFECLAEIDELLDKSFACDPYSKCTLTEARQRSIYYMNHINAESSSPFCSAFIDKIGADALVLNNANLFEMPNVVNYANGYIMSAIKTKGSSKNGGCLSTIACMVAIALGLMALVI